MLPFALHPHLHTARFHHFRAIVELTKTDRQRRQLSSLSRLPGDRGQVVVVADLPPHLSLF